MCPLTGFKSDYRNFFQKKKVVPGTILRTFFFKKFLSAFFVFIFFFPALENFRVKNGLWAITVILLQGNLTSKTKDKADSDETSEIFFTLLASRPILPPSKMLKVRLLDIGSVIDDRCDGSKMTRFSRTSQNKGLVMLWVNL